MNDLKEEVSEFGFESPRVQARVASLVGGADQWGESELRDTAWLVRYLQRQRDLLTENLSVEAQQLYDEHRAVCAQRTRVATPFDVREKALRERLTSEIATELEARSVGDERRDELLGELGLSVARAWKATVTDPVALLGALASGDIAEEYLDIVKFNQSALNRLARRLKKLRPVPGVEIHQGLTVVVKKEEEEENNA